VEVAVVRRLIAACASLAIAVPGAVLALGTAFMMLGAITDSPSWWRVEPVNLSEAAALRDRATVARLMAAGEDPYVRREIRADLVFNHRVDLSAIEAGIATRRSEIVDVILFSARMPPDGQAWSHLRCLAQLEGDEDVIEAVDRYRPESAPAPVCDDVKRPWP
jgi:hypothetical protein